MKGLSRRTFIKTGLAGAALVACGALLPGAKWLLHPVGAAPGFQTTVERTIVPVPVPATSPKILPSKVSRYAQYGYSAWRFAEGVGYEKRLDLMPAAYAGKAAKKTARLLRFFTIADIHISDKESPAQAIFYGYKGGVSSGYSPVMLYTTHVLDAVVRTVNAIHKQNPLDFGISLGDTCNSTQYNELRWYVDVLDGGAIAPSSGKHAGADTIDYQKPYKAAGLDIPWYQTLGNHDHFWMGFMPPNDYIRQSLVGENIVNLGNLFADPRGLDSRGFYMGAIDGSTPYGDIIGAGPEKDFPTPPKVAAADPDRRSLSKKEWMSEFLKTSSKPVGHGFSQANVDKDFACYSFEPKADLPLKVIVLDDTQRHDESNNPPSLGYGHGSIDEERYVWLVRELEKGQAEGKLMIIAAHIPIGVESGDSMMAWSKDAYVSEGELFAKLHEYPNLIAWIAGHRHINTVTAFTSPDPERPELGFWQVETASLRDFPQQFRTFEIVRNSDNTVSIFVTNVNPTVEDGSPAAISRSYAVGAQQVFNNEMPFLPSGSYNAELVKKLSPEMQAKISNCGTPIRE
ncbi:MAG: TIGR03768 family metallophosphoesterase [Sporomusaceae bacterium]|nr:TIGR03768 family metallophosphoesterase [Sporomusaceae bacterium]